MTRLLLLTFLAAAVPALAEPVVEVGNDIASRELTFDGHAWRTTKFTCGSESLATRSDEFHIRLMDDREWTVADFQADGEPVLAKDGKTSILTIRYKWPDSPPEGAPENVIVRYTAAPGEGWTRKTVALVFPEEATVDRLEVERFSAAGEASRGGRGEPVFLAGKWFFGLEYPAGHSRHTDGNTPAADEHHFEMVGNYSFVDLEGRDKDAKGRPGLIRLFHFPGYAVKNGGKWQIVSKTAVAGGGGKISATDQFTAYLGTIEKPDRSFTHYNNWFDPAGKSLKGDNLPNIYQQFAEATKPYGVRIDAMVPDNGWQDNQSVWEPSAGHFPGGFPDLVKLSENLRQEGTSLGLWLSLDGTQTNIKWGESQGYAKAKANKYFSQYFAHYSLSQPSYHAALEKQLIRLAGEGKVSYFKHDFNHLSDTGEGNGHPPTDRHGHEANVDAMISLLQATRTANPQVYQNLTNWVWFSPWWLMHGDALWMLAGDDGANGNWPELSVRNMATTDRDTYLWRMWGDPADHPLVPISRLMTHGIILNEKHQLEGPGDGVREWADHVMMYYGRGIQMKEWYITPKVATPEHWKALGTIHRWAEKNFKALANSTFIGGRPDEGHVYGYIGWDGNHGVLVTRNPSAETQVLRIPFNSAAGPPREFHSNVVFPYHAYYSGHWTGRDIEIEVPGYQTLALEFSGGRAMPRTEGPPAVTVKADKNEAAFILPADSAGRAEILVIGYPNLPEVKINGALVEPKLTSKAKLNAFPDYARSGMPSEKARAWTMASFDVKALAGKEVKVSLVGGEGDSNAEAWLLADREGKDAPEEGKDLPWAIDANLRRQTTKLIAERPVSASAVETRALTPAELSSLKAGKITLGVFGISPKSTGEKTLWLNGRQIAELPAGPDAWQNLSFDLKAEDLKTLKAGNLLEIHRSTGEDKFKFHAAILKVQLTDGTWISSSKQQETQTSDKDWACFEGKAFPSEKQSDPVQLEFK